jgi:malate:Na+ symporter
MGGERNGGDATGPNPVWRLRGRWSGAMGIRIGALPLPLYIVLAVLLIALAVGASGRESDGVVTTLVMIAVGASTFAEIGRRLPAIRNIGFDVILAVFVPSFLVYVSWIPRSTIARTRELFLSSDVVGVFIAVLIVGSIVSIDRRALIVGSARIFVPLFAGSVAAVAAGTVVGAATGLGSFRALFFVIAPILGGGVSAGAIPLSVGYASILGTPPGDILAAMLPAVILGNLAAMVCAGLLGFYEKKFARAPGRDRLMGAADPAVEHKKSGGMARVIAATSIVALIYLAGAFGLRAFDLPAPLTVLVIAVGLNLSNGLSPRLRAGVQTLYGFFTSALTFPLLFAVGLFLTPWTRLVEGLAPANLATIIACVGAMAAAGFVASRWIGLNPADGAIVAVTRAAMGGTGDIAILSAGGRLALMPFAQIATRIGGAATVAAALIAIEYLAR